MYMIFTCVVFCKVTNDDVILINLVTIQGHIGLMT
jgi:hypothetical protein